MPPAVLSVTHPDRMETEIRILDVAVVVCGLLGLLLMGLRFSSSNRTTEDYFLGNRSMPGWLVGISLVGTSISSITFLALPAAAFALDWRLIVNNLMLPVGIVMAVFVFIPLFRQGRITSAFEYLGARFGPILRLYGAVSFIIVQLLRLSTVLYLASLPVSLLLGTPVVTVILVGGIFISIYTMFGGIKAVIWTDLVQTVILLGGGVICLVTIIAATPGGLSEIVSRGASDGKFSLGDFDLDFARRTFWTMTILGVFQWLTDYSSNQTIIQRYLAVSSTREARKAVLLCGVVSIPIWAFFFFLGTALYGFYTTVPDPAVAGLPADSVLPYFLQTKVMVGVTGLVIVGILAAAMSTLDSGINSISTVAVVDFVRGRRVAPDSRGSHLASARIAAGGAGVLMITGALIYHQMPRESMLDFQVIVTALFGGCLGGLFLVGIFTTRVDGSAALGAVGIAIAANAYLLLNQMRWLPESWLFDLHAYWVGLSVNAVFVVSALGLSLRKRARGPRPQLGGLTAWTMTHEREPARKVPAMQEHS